MKKLMMFKTKGMNLDLSVSAFNPEFSFENRNLRLSTNDGNTLMSWVNERGTSFMSITIDIAPWIEGAARLWTREDIAREEMNSDYDKMVAMLEALDALPNPEEELYEAAVNDLLATDTEAGCSTIELYLSLLLNLQSIYDGIDFSNEGLDKYKETKITGTPIGTAILNHKLVVFTHDEHSNLNAIKKDDFIYVFELGEEENTLEGKLLYHGILGFDYKHPIETLVSYEGDAIQKVYWVDGLNQPRMINIALDYLKLPKYNNTSFDFVSTLKLEEEVKVLRQDSSVGKFASGVIQYAFTYYKLYGLESNIFYTSPLLYVAHKERGAAPDEAVGVSFKITVNHVDDLFDYLRIYSIHRSSLNGTPIVKRVLDIDISILSGEDKTAVFTDNGSMGDAVDPEELFYKGGKKIAVGTIEQKDGKLFMGNILDIKTNNAILSTIRLAVDQMYIDGFTESTRIFRPDSILKGDYIYDNLLDSRNLEGDRSVPCGGFKCGNTYRLGVQFLYETGEWSEPFYVKDKKILTTRFSYNAATNEVTAPVLKGSLRLEYRLDLLEYGVKKIRGVVVFPEMRDREVVCQGVICPTLYTKNHRGYTQEVLGEQEEEIVLLGDRDLYAQSSWFFRTETNSISNSNGSICPVYDINRLLLYTSDNYNFNPSHIRQVEVQGNFSDEDKFKIDSTTVTFHSPDVLFNDDFYYLGSSALTAQHIGGADFKHTFSNINIQTETPTISANAEGVIHKSFSEDYTYGIVAGPFYDDGIVVDNNNVFGVWSGQTSSVKWLVYPWNKSGSLNNDIERPVNTGVRSAVLKKKVIANLRYAETVFESGVSLGILCIPKLFSSDSDSIIKLESYLHNEGLQKSNIYMGNINTLLNPNRRAEMFFAFNSSGDKTPLSVPQVITPFETDDWWKTSLIVYNNTIKREVRKYSSNDWLAVLEFNSSYDDLFAKKESVRIKYKSTPHLVICDKSSAILSFYEYPTPSLYDSSQGYTLTNDEFRYYHRLPIVELKKSIDSDIIYGGNSSDALKANVWIPCGEPVSLAFEDENDDNNVEFEYSYGDTYFQRWDCLKTYAYTPEDINLIVEIGSFMLETYVNIDGRYDRNRGQSNNVNMGPLNFNLLNPVYSQPDNFFSYKILNTGNQINTKFPNLVTWSRTKESGADIDVWTLITLASILELDGDKGKVSKLTRLNDLLIAFLDRGISLILYNENVQIASTEGVPIEIANSEAVRGKRYLSDTIGCSNKWSLTNTPVGIYFMDSYDKSIYRFNGELTNLSRDLGFNSWAKREIPSANVSWNPKDFDDFVTYYDKLNLDVLFISKKEALAYSEKLNTFTSFYSYDKAPYFCNLLDKGIWISKDKGNNSSPYLFYRHLAGNYGTFFGEDYGYSITLIGNPEPLVSKIFTNLEFRACTNDEGVYYNSNLKFYLPFDTIETWNEYQHGESSLQLKNGHGNSVHYLSDGTSALQRKFRIWRCDIPRDNVYILLAAPNRPREGQENDVAFMTMYTLLVKGFNRYSDEINRGIFRTKANPLDRMTNPWIYIKLSKEPDAMGSTLNKTEIHDMVLTYFD